MKYLNLIVLISLLSCSQSIEQTRNIDELIQTIAGDSNYFEYQIAMIDHTNYMTANVYDIKEILGFMDANKHLDLCDDTTLYLNTVRGGKEYKEVHCRKVEYYKKLSNKYPGIFSLEGKPEIRTAIHEYFLKNSTEFQAERTKRNNLMFNKLKQ